MKPLKEQLSQISIKRVLFALMISLLLLNSIKIPPNHVPVVHVPILDAEATSTPYLIMTKNKNPHPFVLAHERCHIHQANRYGSVWVIVLNAYYLGTYGYLNNPLEKQANSLTGICAPEQTWMIDHK